MMNKERKTNTFMKQGEKARKENEEQRRCRMGEERRGSLRGMASNEANLTHSIIRDLMVGKRPAALIATFFTKHGRKGNLYFVHLRTFNKRHLV